MMPRKQIALIVLGFALFLGTNAHAQEERSTARENQKQQNWPMYGRNLSHSFSNGASKINPGNVAKLRPLWQFATADAVSASPTVVNSVLYVGSWDGFFYALD